MKTIIKFLGVAIFMSLVGCVAPPKSTKSALELQAVQAKEFETTKTIAFAATLSVLQDQGYIIGSASLETGLISGKSPTVSTNQFFYQEMKDDKVTAFIEQLGSQRTKVRLNFVNSSTKSGGYGQIVHQESPIEDASTYQSTFSLIQQGIFVRKNTN